MDSQTCAQSGQVSLTGCLQVLTIKMLEYVAALDVFPDMFVGWFNVDVSWVLFFFPECLSEEVQSDAVLQLQALQVDLLCWKPGPPDELVCGPRQNDGNPTLDVSAHP